MEAKVKRREGIPILLSPGFNVYIFYYRHQERARPYIYTMNNQLGTASFLS